MRGFVDTARHLGLAVLVVCTGCGYRLVQPGAPGPVPPFRLGDLHDRTTEGDLAMRTRRGLRDALAARGEPPSRSEDDGPVWLLEGEVDLGNERTSAFDAFGAVFEVELRGRFRLVRPDEPWPLWRSGDVVARAVYARGPTATAQEANRRVALETAAAALADRLLERLAERPPVETPQ